MSPVGNMNNESRNSVKRKKSRKRLDQLNPVEVVARKRSEKNAASAVQTCRRFLTVIGMWRPSDSNKYSWRLGLSNFLLIACLYGFAIRSIPAVVYVILDTRDPTRICYILGRLLFVMMSFSKYVFLWFRRRAIMKSMKNIKEDWLGVETSASRDIMIKHSRYGLLVTRFVAALTYFTAIWQAMLPYVARRAVTAVVNENGTQVVKMTERRFPVASHFGSSLVTKTPVYEFIYTSQMLATYMMHTVAIACYSIAVVVVMHACGQLKILMEKIKNLIDGDGEETEYNNVDIRLSNIIRHHARTLRFISSAEKMLREICLIDLCGYTIELCMVGYFNIVEWKAENKSFIAIATFLTLEMTFTFNIFSFCYVGELLTQECNKVGEMAYMIDWYRMPGKQPLALCLIITMSHNPVTLTAGGAVQLSFRCFASVLKTALGYLNMLRAVMD